MTRDASECCGLCENFVLNNRAQANEGNGWCSGYERYVHATSHPTVLFNPAQRGQMPERRAFVEKHKEK
jgi:hypothetical protein